MNNTKYAVTAKNLTKLYGKTAAVSHLEMNVRRTPHRRNLFPVWQGYLRPHN